MTTDSLEEREKESSKKESLYQEIYNLLEVQPIDLDDEIERIAKTYSKKPVRIKEQLELICKEEKSKKEKIIKDARGELSNAEFDFLQRNCINERIQNYLNEGLDYINLNDIVRAEVRVWLKKYNEESVMEKRLVWDFIKLTTGKDKDWAKATELLVDYIKERNYLYTTKSDTKPEFFIYKEGIYVPDGKSEIKNQLRDALGPVYNQFIFNKVIEKLEPDTYIEPDQFFGMNNKWEIPVENGILNLQTLELEPFNPEKVFFSKIRARYKPGCTCEAIGSFLKQVLAKEEDIDVFYEMVGFILLKEYTYEKAFMLVGDGRNGKGKSIELIKRLIGPENCCSLPLNHLIPESFEISTLYNKMANLAGDIGNQDLKETSFFKSLTGRDLVTGKRKFLNPINFENFAKFIFACNELPMVYDLTRGFWDRWVLLEYPYTFVTQEEYDNSEERTKFKIKDDNIMEKITAPEEMSGFLNIVILGLHRLIKNKKFSQTAGTEEIKSTWIRKSNSFISFAYDNLEPDYEGIIIKKDLRKRYADYCKQHKIGSKSDYVIKRFLQEAYGASEDKQSVPGFGEWQHVWTGIKWK